MLFFGQRIAKDYAGAVRFSALFHFNSCHFVYIGIVKFTDKRKVHYYYDGCLFYPSFDNSNVNIITLFALKDNLNNKKVREFEFDFLRNLIKCHQS